MTYLIRGKYNGKTPGKLVKNLNLLSGEKAGTGIAFVFSIFRIILHHFAYLMGRCTTR